MGNTSHSTRKELWLAVKELKKQGFSNRQIAKELGMSKDTVGKYIKVDLNRIVDRPIDIKSNEHRDWLATLLKQAYEDLQPVIGFHTNAKYTEAFIKIEQILRDLEGNRDE